MIERYCNTRKINSLYHFTKIDNLESILTNGLVPVLVMRENKINYKANDLKRLDGTLEATSVSIGFPNYKLFTKFRFYEYPNYNWCVLELKREILWEKQCKFCSGNAASSAQKLNREAKFNDIDALKEMFQDNRWGRDLFSKLPSDYTYNPQAEVLVYDIIEPSYIKRIIFNENRFTLRYKHNENFEKFVFETDIELFKPRKDYKEW